MNKKFDTYMNLLYQIFNFFNVLNKTSLFSKFKNLNKYLVTPHKKFAEDVLL